LPVKTINYQGQTPLHLCIGGHGRGVDEYPAVDQGFGGSADGGQGGFKIGGRRRSGPGRMLHLHGPVIFFPAPDCNLSKFWYNNWNKEILENL